MSDNNPPPPDLPDLSATNTNTKTPDDSADEKELTWYEMVSMLKSADESALPFPEIIQFIRGSSGTDIDSKDVCQICYDPYHIANEEGEIEKPVMVACGHIFGSNCIERSLALPMENKKFMCPVCRFPLKFSRCGHAIAAVDPYDAANPAPVVLKKESDIPACCSECAVRRRHNPEVANYINLSSLMKYYEITTDEINTRALQLKSKSVGNPEIAVMLARDASRKAQMQIEQEKLAEALPAAKLLMEEVVDKYMDLVEETNPWRFRAKSTRWIPVAEEDEDDDDEDDDGWGPDLDDLEDEEGDDDDDEIADDMAEGREVEAHSPADTTSSLVLEALAMSRPRNSILLANQSEHELDLDLDDDWGFSDGDAESLMDGLEFIDRGLQHERGHVGNGDNEDGMSVDEEEEEDDVVMEGSQEPDSQVSSSSDDSTITDEEL